MTMFDMESEEADYDFKEGDWTIEAFQTPTGRFIFRHDIFPETLYCTSVNSLLEKCETSKGEEDIEYKDPVDDIMDDCESLPLYLEVFLDALM